MVVIIKRKGGEILNQRIKEIRTCKKLTMEQFSKQLGVSKAAISQWENGKANPSDQTIKSICREFNVEEKWLRTGEGDMINPRAVSELDKMLEKHGLSDDERTLIKRFVNLTQEQRTAVTDFLLKSAADLADINAHTTTIPENGIKSSHKNLDPQVATKEEKMAAYQEYLDEQEKKQREAN